MFPHVFFVVLSQKCVEKRIDAAIGICQTRGQIIDIPLGFERKGKQGVELAQQLPDPEGQEACPEEDHNGEDQVQYLLEQRCSNKYGNYATKYILEMLGSIHGNIFSDLVENQFPCKHLKMISVQLNAIVHMPGQLLVVIPQTYE